MRTSPRFTGVCLLLLGACAPRSSDSVTLLVAASLTDAVTELVSEYQRDTGAVVPINSGASGALATQIEWGAPCDLFLSADPRLMARLVAAHRVTLRDTRTIARNRLVLATSTGDASLGGGPSVLLSPAVRRIAIADPEAAPAGRYAREALESLGLWDQLQAKLVRAGDVRGATHLLALRTVQAAIIYRTDAESVDHITTVMTFDETAHTPIEYMGAVVPSRQAGDEVRSGERLRLARGLLAFLGSERAAAVWRKHGFQPVTPSD